MRPCGAGLRRVVGGERGELDELVAGDEPGAAEALLGEADVAAEADAVVLA